MSKYPFSYDPACPIRDPRTKGLDVSPDDVVLDMASVIALKARDAHDGTVFEADLLDAGFTRAEIETHIHAARHAAAERLAPRQVEAAGKKAAA